MKKKLLTILLIFSLLGNAYFLAKIYTDSQRNDVMSSNMFQQYFHHLLYFKNSLDSYINNTTAISELDAQHKSLQNIGLQYAYFSGKSKESFVQEILKLTDLLEQIIIPGHKWDKSDLRLVHNELHDLVMENNTIVRDYIQNNGQFSTYLNEVLQLLTETNQNIHDILEF
ncbi:hypothetical protein [Bacillus horti]|uniref:Uncharacterized protein n=1 Tax=Caldalkalibacillus horti TaxID=77523 RepID=A0ABT9W4G5_9BACI|nr:hypothetical protein [Bacillus horti]MDQ0168128.1 hypothetical protein [Bacillus horti]